MCFFSEWKPGDYISLAALIISGLTLFLGFKAYKKLLAQEASKKQLEVVNNLVNNIVSSSILLSMRNIKKSIFHPGYYNIFDFAAKPFVEGDEARNMVVLSVDLYNTEFLQIFKDIRNPLLPPEIADRIYAFSGIGFPSKLTAKQIEAPVYIIGYNPAQIRREVNVPQIQLYNGLNDWLQICKNVQSSIFEWYKEKGIKKINLIALRLDKKP